MPYEPPGVAALFLCATPCQKKAKARSREAIKGFRMLPNKRGSRDVDSHVHCLPVEYVATHTLLAMSELGRNGRKRPQKRPVLPSLIYCAALVED